MEGKMILIEQEMLEKILKEIEHIKEILTNNHIGRYDDKIYWLDNAELMQYLHISGRTALTIQKKGLRGVRSLVEYIISRI